MNVSGKHSWLKHLDFIVIDLVCLAFSFALAYFLRFGNFSWIGDSRWLGLLALLELLNFVITFLTNPYSGIFRRPYYEDVLKMLLLAIYGFVGACVFFYLFKLGEDYSRLALASTYLIYYLLSLAIKCVHKKLILSRRLKGSTDIRNLLVIAAPGDMEETVEYIKSTDYQQFKIVAFSFIDGGASDGEPEEYRGLPVVPFAQVVDYVTKTDVDDVFVGSNPMAVSGEVYGELVSNGVVTHLNIESIIGVQSDVQSVARIGVYKTLTVAAYTADSRKMLFFAVKRLVDIVFALVGCVFLLPLMLVVKLSYLLSGDTAPIVYRQTRVGLRGRTFQLYKLRSMVANADEVLQELLKDEVRRAEWEENQKFEDDPRITKIGAFLRKTSLDEFPQFFNVLKGDMSIVGPRPLIVGELEAHGGRSLYNKVRPGLTGWWGCNGRSNINYRERLELEYHYVKHCSFYMDILCVLRTFGAVLKRDGAK